MTERPCEIMKYNRKIANANKTNLMKKKSQNLQCKSNSFGLKLMMIGPVESA